MGRQSRREVKKKLSIRKGQNADFLETGKKQIQKPSRLISAGKAKPKEAKKELSAREANWQIF